MTVRVTSPSNTSERGLEESTEKFPSGAIVDTRIPKDLKAVAWAQSDYFGKVHPARHWSNSFL